MGLPEPDRPRPEARSGTAARAQSPGARFAGAGAHALAVIVLLALLVAPTRAAGAADLAWRQHQLTRCNASSPEPWCYHYNRCKATRRCNLGDEDYDLESRSLSFHHRWYAGGDKHRASLLNDFEDFRTGTWGWTASDSAFVHEVERNASEFASGLLSSDFALIGELDVSAGVVVFNTSGETPTVSDGSSVRDGVVALTASHGTEVAVFSFDWVYLGAGVNVTVVGDRVLALYSRSSSIVDTHIIVEPGEAGGMPGGGRLGAVNPNGPTSPSCRMSFKTLTTHGSHRDEVQVITSSAQSGQTLGGRFALSHEGYRSQWIDWDASAAEVRNAIEAGLPMAGRVKVTRPGRPDSQGGRSWRVTFTSQSGNAAEMAAVTTQITGMNASVVVETEVDGNEVDGAFRLGLGDKWTADIPAHSTAEELAELLREGLELDQVFATRSDPSGECKPGVCDSSNREPANGYVWEVVLCDKDDVSPSGPTGAWSWQGRAVAQLSVNASLLSGDGAVVLVNDTRDFSVALGGAGGSLGGRGGEGYAGIDPGDALATETLPDLMAGSGGAAGAESPLRYINRGYVDGIRGGHGGGGLFLHALNDLTIGGNARLQVDGGEGQGGMTAGGGGSGGAIMLLAGGAIVIEGELSAQGGAGGSGALSGGGGGGGFVSVIAQSVFDYSALVEVGGAGSAEEGRYSVVEFHDGLTFRVDPTDGGAGTNKSLVVEGAATISSASGATRALDVARSGVRFTFEEPSQPQRVSFYVKVDEPVSGDSIVDTYGALFSLYAPGDFNQSAIGVALSQGAFLHGTGHTLLPTQELYNQAPFDQWHKVDISINWGNNTYHIRINDVERAAWVRFDPSVRSLAAVGLHNLNSMQTWWDEIYAGPDSLMGFRCPVTTRKHGVTVDRPAQNSWPKRAFGERTMFHDWQRHETHVSDRAEFREEYQNGGLVPFDGPPHRKYHYDLPLDLDNDNIDPHNSVDGNLDSGELFQDPRPLDASNVVPLDSEQYQRGSTWMTEDGGWSRDGDRTHGGDSGSMYWYADYANPEPTGSLMGGICACSTTDRVNWRNEGVMLNWINISDPFGVARDTMMAQQAKVIYNAATDTYVMWMHVDNTTSELGLTGVATSPHANGPFTLDRTFYPDAPFEAPGGLSINETQDQTLVQQEGGKAFLVRSYLKTVSYWMPRPVMQPQWDSVKRTDGTIDYGLNYHRAFYHRDYDNPDDIYEQRWRLEDVPWKVECCYDDDEDNCFVNYRVPGVNVPDACPEGTTKVIRGQGIVPVESRYKDPNSEDNNAWLPSATSSFTTWGHQVYNHKAWQGSYFDALQTNITYYTFVQYAGRATRLAAHLDSTVNKPWGTSYEYPNAYESDTYIDLENTTTIENLLDTLGVPVTEAMYEKYAAYELLAIDPDDDGMIYAGEDTSTTRLDVKQSVLDSLDAEVLEERDAQTATLDMNGDQRITFYEFEQWAYNDIDLIFDQYDLDKTGFLDMEEMFAFFRDRHMPRFARLIIESDPDFDGRVYYQRFLELLEEVPSLMYAIYDYDDSGILESTELNDLTFDMDVNLDGQALATLRDGNDSVAFTDYAAWVRSYPSHLHGYRDSLKKDNYPHQTFPDELIGPLQVVEYRRAKYVAVSELTDDYLDTTGLMREIEGGLENRLQLNMLNLSEWLMGLEESETGSYEKSTVDFRREPSLGHRPHYWNGREFEGRPELPTTYTYAQQCINSAGVEDEGCPVCINHSPFLTGAQEVYRDDSTASLAHCNNDADLDLALKRFDTYISDPLRYQQRSRTGTQGDQADFTPCRDPTEHFLCDVCQDEYSNTIDCFWDDHPQAAWNP